MHIYFSGIGGVGIGPLALIAKQAGYEVSGSDLQDGQYVQYLRQQGITDILAKPAIRFLNSTSVNRLIGSYTVLPYPKLTRTILNCYSARRMI
jgi:UDP-N-acetylmuramate-alanine ligase